MSTSVGIGVGVVHGSLGDTGAPVGPVITLSGITPSDAKVYESALPAGSAPDVANRVVTGTISVDYGVPGPAAVDPLTINGTAVPAGGTTISGNGGDLVLGADSGSGNVKTHAFTYTHDTAVTNINGSDFADAFSIEATDTAAEARNRSLLVLIVDDGPTAGFMDNNSNAASPQGLVPDGGRIGYLWWNDDTYAGGADDVPQQAYQAGVGGVRLLSQPAEGTAYISDGTVPHPVSGFYANGAIIYDAPADPSQATPVFTFTYELVDADGSVSNTETAQVAVSASLNSTPNMLAAIPDSGDDQYTQLVVTWEYTDATDWADIDRYILQRSDTGAGGWVTLDNNLPKLAATPNDPETYVDTGLTPGEDYFYEVYAVDDDPFTAAQSLNQAQGTLPNYPTPAAPTGFTAAAQDFQSIQLDWTLPTPGTFDSVELEYQEDGAGGWITIGGIAVDQVQYTHIGLKDSTQYNYRIRVRNRFGVPSAYATAFDTTGALVGPTFVSAVFDGIDKYTLTWNDANYETSYRLFRRINAGTQQELIPSPAADDTTYEDQPITQLGLEHEYELWSVRSGYATLTDTIADTPTAAKPATPPAPIITIDSATSLNITWADGAGPVTNVRLERSDDDPTPLTWTEVGTYAAGAGVAGITDSGLTPSTLYHYRVIAINQGTESDPSVYDSETTPSDLFKPDPQLGDPPTVSGTLFIGDTVTVTYPGGWSANPGVSSYRYEFKADGVPVQDGLSTSYTILTGDAGKAITVDVWATNSQGESDTAHVVAIGDAPAASVPSAGAVPVIALQVVGQDKVGDVIVATATGDPWDAGNPQDMGAKSYIWRRNGTPIVGAPDQGSYTITTDDDNVAIDLIVQRTNTTGDGPSTDSNNIQTAALTDPTFDVPTLDSADLSPWEGIEINVNTITGIDYGNPDTGTPPEYQWERDITGVGDAYLDIGGETGSSYTVGPVGTDPVGTLIRCKVTVTNDNAASLEQTTSNVATVVIIPVPYYSGGIGITQLDGDLKVGSRIECDEGSWSNSPSFEYRWDNVEDGPGISLNDIYTIQISDMNDNLNVTITRAFNGVGDSPDTPVTSSNLQMAPAADPSGSPSIVERVPGDNSVGDFLDAVTGLWDFGNPPTQQGGFTYEWEFSTDDVVFNPITGPAETGTSYEIRQTDVDNSHYIRCVVTGTNTNGAATPEVTNSIQAEAPIVLTPVYVSGMQITFTDKLIGSTLTCDEGTWNPAATSYTYQWYRGATPIGTDQRTYDLVEADAGQSITVQITGASNANGPSVDPQLPIISAPEVADPLADPSFSVTLDDLTPSDGDEIAAQVVGMDWGNPPGTGTLGYQWQRDTAGGTNWSNISPGGDQATYTVVDANDPVGTTLRCVVTADNTGSGQTIENSNVATVQSGAVLPPQTGRAAELLRDWATGSDGLAIAFTDNTIRNGKANAVSDILGGGLVVGGTPAVKWIRDSDGTLKRRPQQIIANTVDVDPANANWQADGTVTPGDLADPDGVQIEWTAFNNTIRNVNTAANMVNGGLYLIAGWIKSSLTGDYAVGVGNGTQQTVSVVADEWTYFELQATGGASGSIPFTLYNNIIGAPTVNIREFIVSEAPAIARYTPNTTTGAVTWGIPFDHDEANRPLGALNEPQATNLQNNSTGSAIAGITGVAGWDNLTGMTATPNGANGPHGVQDCTVVEETGVNEYHHATPSANNTAKTNYAIVGPHPSNTSPYIAVQRSSGTAGRVIVDTSNWTITEDTLGTGFCEPVGGGFYRVGFTDDAAGGTGWFWVHPRITGTGDIASFLGVAGRGFCLWHVQQEDIVGPTSPISVVNTPGGVTRDPDFYTYPLNNETWYPMGAAFSMNFNAHLNFESREQWLLNTATFGTTESFILANNLMQSYDGTNVINFKSNTDIGSFVPYNLGLSGGGSNMDAVRNGGQDATNPGTGAYTGGAFNANSGIVIGANFSTTLYYMHGHIKEIVLVPEQRTVAEMQILTQLDGNAGQLLRNWATGNDGMALDFTDNSMRVDKDGTSYGDILATGVTVTGTPADKWMRLSNGMLKRRAHNHVTRTDALDIANAGWNDGGGITYGTNRDLSLDEGVEVTFIAAQNWFDSIPGTSLVPDEEHTIEFEAKALTADFTLSVRTVYDLWDDAPLTSEWQTFTFTGTPPVNDRVTRFRSKSGSPANSQMAIRRIRIYRAPADTAYIHNVTDNLQYGLPFDHEANGTPLGILNEPQAENTWANNTTPSTYVTNAGVALVDNQVPGPDGQPTSAHQLQELDSASNGWHRTYRTQNPNGDVTFSVIIGREPGSSRHAAITAGGTIDIFSAVTLDLDTGAVTNVEGSGFTGTTVDYGSEPIGNGFYRVWLSLESAGNFQWNISVAETPTVDANWGFPLFAGTTGTPGLAISHMQLEYTTYKTSPIITSGSSATRDPDQYEIPASVFGTWVDFQAAGSVFSRHTPYAGLAITNNRGGHMYYVEGAAAPRGIFGVFLRAGDWPNYMVNNSGTTLSTGMYGTKDVENTCATSWEDPAVVNPDITITSVNGVATSSLNGSPCVMGDASDGVLFGSGGTTANINSSFHFHGHFKELVIIPEVKSQTDLDTLSAP